MTKKLESIKKVRFILTDFCNYRCRFCHNEGFQTKNSSFLAQESIFLLTEAAKNLNIPKITLTGGEPLLHKDIVNIVKQIKKIYPEVSLGMSTNGMLLSDKNFFDVLPLIDRLRLNCQSLNNDTCQNVCGQSADVNKIIWIVDNAKRIDSNINICLNFVLTTFNKNSLFDVLKFAFDKNIDVKILEYKCLNEDLYVDVKFAKDILKSFSPIKIEKDYQDDDIYFFDDFKGKIRLCYSFCNNLKCASCRECGEIRLTPTLKLKHCFDERGEESNIASQIANFELQAIEKEIIKIDKLKGKVFKNI